MTRRKVPEGDIRHPSRREERRASAHRGWFNWHLDRGRLDREWPRYGPTAKALRMVSWRRAL